MGESFEEDEEVRARLDPGEMPTYLLMPGPESVEIGTLADRGPIGLVIPDGTWWEVTRILKANPRLSALPRTFVRPSRPSRFPLRRPPIEGLRSTAEAVVDALVALEGSPERFEGLMGALDAFVAENERHAASPGGRPRQRRRRRKGGEKPPPDGEMGARRRAWLRTLRNPPENPDRATTP